MQNGGIFLNVWSICVKLLVILSSLLMSYNLSGWEIESDLVLAKLRRPAERLQFCVSFRCLRYNIKINWFPKEKYQMHTKKLLPPACHSHQTPSNAAIKVADPCSLTLPCLFSLSLRPSGGFLQIIPCPVTVGEVSIISFFFSFYWRRDCSVSLKKPSSGLCCSFHYIQLQ